MARLGVAIAWQTGYFHRPSRGNFWLRSRRHVQIQMIEMNAENPESDVREAHRMPPEQSKWFVIIFLLAIISFSFLLTRGIRPTLDGIRDQAKPDEGYFTCVKLVSGDTIWVQPAGGPVTNTLLEGMRTVEPQRSEPEAEKTVEVGDESEASGTASKAHSTKSSNKSGKKKPVYVVKILGIEAPPIDSDPLLQKAFADKIGMSPADLARPRSAITKKNLAEISRNALQAYIYRQRLKLDFPNPNDLTSAYVICNGDDVGKLQLIYGQALTTGEEHRFAESYEGFMREARRQQRGIWKSRNL